MADITDRRFDDVYTATPTLDTSALADNDVASDTLEVPYFFLSANSTRLLQSLFVLDTDDQGVGFDLFLMNSNVSLGTKNSAPSISDADAASIIGRVSVTASDYVDLGGCRVADITPIGKVLKGGGVSTSLWLSLVTRSGTPTYTAAGLKLKIGVI